MGALWGLVFLVGTSLADLDAVEIIRGKVGVTTDAAYEKFGVSQPFQQEIPAGADIIKSYLYVAGTPFPWYADSPNDLGDYNLASIQLGGYAVTNFDHLVGAISDRPEIGQWYTGRADVTEVLKQIQLSGSTDSIAISEGALSDRIDGMVLVSIFSHPSLSSGSVVLFDGGRKTGGDLSTITLLVPLTGVGTSEFFARMALGISFSANYGQESTVEINGNRLTSSAGKNDDGVSEDGGLITMGGVGDDPSNPFDAYSSDSLDDELYDLSSYLSDGLTSFDIQTANESNDDNIFVMTLHVAADVARVE